VVGCINCYKKLNVSFCACLFEFCGFLHSSIVYCKTVPINFVYVFLVIKVQNKELMIKNSDRPFINSKFNFHPNEGMLRLKGKTKNINKQNETRINSELKYKFFYQILLLKYKINTSK
jgi:hypothetical protein